MNNRARRKEKTKVRCAIYTRKSTDEGLDREFNTLDAQRESAEAYIASQRQEGWLCLMQRYDDGGYTGGNMQRPALKRLLADIEAGQVDCVIVYKVDRLSRSLLDFAKMMQTFDERKVSFVSVTQQFNTSQSMGRLTLNILFSFAQFEREIISERTRDKMGAARRKGKWLGGTPVLGYGVDWQKRRLIVDPDEAERVRTIFQLYLQLGGLTATAEQLARRSWINKRWTTRKGIVRGGKPFTKAGLHYLLTNVTYRGQVKYQDQVYEGDHKAIVLEDTFTRVRDLLERNRGRRRPRRTVSPPALLESLLWCSACNSPMVFTYTTKGPCRYRYYVCSHAQKQGHNGCPCKSIPATEIEEFVMQQVLNQNGSASAHPSWQSLNSSEQAGALNQRIQRVNYDGHHGDLTIELLPDNQENES